MNSGEIDAVVIPGHRVASGQAEDSPYPMGTIAMQVPYFKAQGLDLSAFHSATLNLSISPHQFSIIKPDYEFKQVAWAEGFPCEDFSFIKCEIMYHQVWYKGYVYYPHPETKIDHFQDESTLEIIAEYIEGLCYENRVRLRIKPDQISII